jgi:gliding motility-associated-like protein
MNKIHSYILRYGGQFNGLPSGSTRVWVQDANNCVTSGSWLVNLNDNLLTSIGANPTICQGQSVVLPAGSNGVKFSWSPTTGLSDPNVLTPTASPATTTQYTLTTTWGACTGKQGVTVNVNPAPVPDAGPNQQTCDGVSVQLHGTGGQCSWTPITWLDNSGSATPTVVSPTHTITYSLNVTDANSCTSLQPAMVTITVMPQAVVSAGNDTSILKGKSVQLGAADVNGSGFTSWTWSPASGLSDPATQDPVATPQVTTTYIVEATSPAGCTATGSVTLKVYATVDILVPSGFTPNGDGHNDVLRAIPMGIREFRYFVVYNRWGVRVFQTTDPTIGWDGTIGGQAQPSDTFVWMAAGVDYDGNLIQRKGTTILIR